MQTPGKKCDFSPLINQLWKDGNDFINDKAIRKRFGVQADSVVKQVFQDVFSVDFAARNSVDVTKGRLKSFNNRLDQIKIALNKGKLSHSFGSTFYAPTAVHKKNPQLTTLMDKLHNTTLSYNGRRERHGRMYQEMLTHMKKEMISSEMLDQGMIGGGNPARQLKKATKLANKLEFEIEKLVVDVYNNVPGAKRKLELAMAAEDSFYVKGEGRVFNEMIKTIEQTLPKLEKDALDRWRKKYSDFKSSGKKMSRAQFEKMKNKELQIILSDRIKSEPMRNAVGEYINLMDEMYRVLDNGVNAYSKSIKEGMKGKYSDEKIDEIVSKIRDKIRPDKVKNYYPHYRRILNSDFFDNLMPHMQRVSDAVSESFVKDKATVDKAVQELDTYVSGRLKKRANIVLDKGQDAQNEYSRNFLTTVKRYVDEIDRFNMVAHADRYTRESLNKAKELFRNGKELDGYGESTVRMMADMNQRMKGSYGFQNENVEKAMKTLLALEFTSKIGFNLRSPVKNLGQGLLNFVEFGPMAIKRSRDLFKRDLDLNRKVEDMMDESGFLFADNLAPELIEGNFMGKSFTQKVKITDNETIELKKPSKLSSAYEMSHKVAGFSGQLMGKVENINRKTTFKIAFGKMYEHLKNNQAYVDGLRREGKDIEREILKRARNYAIRKTTLLHFDYSDLSKASWTTNPAGRLLGQFQHYAIKMWEYNTNLIRNAKDDIATGELTGDRAKKAYGMGLIYFGVPALATALTGWTWDNLIEHSPYEQVNKLSVLFTGDDEEIKNAYYGKGILTGLPFIGAPAVSDMLALGTVHEFINFDNEALEMLLTGNNDYALKTGDQKAYDTYRILNTSLARFNYKTLPKITKGDATFITDELGLYRTKETKKYQKDAADLLPQEVLNALDQLEAHKKKATQYGININEQQGSNNRSGNYLQNNNYLNSRK